MNNVYEKLNTEYGAILMDPPYHTHAFDGALAVIYNPGSKENAGIFSQTQGWLILAEALMGHGDRAFLYFTENAPSAQNDRAEIRKLEPYCYGAKRRIVASSFTSFMMRFSSCHINPASSVTSSSFPRKRSYSHCADAPVRE